MYKSGVVVLIPFPFTDLSGSKVRPAVILGQVKNSSDVIVVFVSSAPKSRAGNTEVLVEVEKANGLKSRSVIKCSKIATLDKKMIIGEIGKLSLKDETRLKTTLRKVLKL